MSSVRFLPAFLLASVLSSGIPVTTAAAQSATAAALAAKLQIIRSRAELDAYLKLHAGKDSPLDLLPPLARQRFLDDLHFGDRGLGGFGTGDLATELTREEARQVLVLFGAESYVSGIRFRSPDAPPRWRAANQPPSRIETEFDALSRMERPDGTFQPELHARFDREFSGLFVKPAALGKLDERDLVYLLQAFELVLFDAPTPEDVIRMREVVAAMEHRGVARSADVREVYQNLVRVREFDDARRYAAAHPNAGLPALPRMIDAGTASPHSIWAPSHDGTVLTRAQLDLAPLQILVLSGCHNAEDAAADISADPVLGPVFSRHAHWLMLPPGWEDQSAIADWNRRFQTAQAVQLYDRAEWTLLPPGWSMPTYLIVHNGKVLDRVTGSPRTPENKLALIEALKRTGLLTR